MLPVTRQETVQTETLSALSEKGNAETCLQDSSFIHVKRTEAHTLGLCCRNLQHVRAP